MNPSTPPIIPVEMDQAAALRSLVADRKQSQAAPNRISGMRSIAILSGKGGVGKTNVAVNLALALGELGLRTAILDADLGLANVDVLLGVVPKFNLGHLLRGEKEMKEIVLAVNSKVSIIPGGSGLRELADLDDQKQSWFIEKLSALEEDTDILILDTGAGIHRNVLAFSMAADRTILLTTPEPTAIRDSYSVLKSLCHATKGNLEIGLVVNMAADNAEAESVAERIRVAALHFLNFSVPYLGCIWWDQAVRDAVKQRTPFLLVDGNTVASRSVRTLAYRLLEGVPAVEPMDSWGRGIKTFLFRLARQLNTKG